METVIDLQNSHEMDYNGKSVQRVVDSAPFAYDVERDAKRVFQNKRIYQKDFSYSTGNGIAVGGVARVLIQPPTGELWRLKNALIIAPVASSGATGTHTLRLRVTSKDNLDDSDYDVIIAKSNPADQIVISRNTITTATNLKIPATEQIQFDTMKDIGCTNSYPLVVAYYNETNLATPGGLLKIKLIFEIETINM